ncbi:MAG: ABC transporter permease [Alphaproteobacteria bacterium GM7ARS4]|nr:ABC transporter permease [Alphaproteobacteria bacterium GM7ARS4]
MAVSSYYGFGVFCFKEVKRFLNVPGQTVFAPLISSLLFLIVFTFALKRSVLVIYDVPYIAFLASGLLMMSITQNAFANSSSSILHTKILGNIGDILMVPLHAHEIALAYIIGGVVRGLLVGCTNALLLLSVIVYVDALQLHIGLLLYYSVMGSCMMASLGLIIGLYANKFDHMSSINNFIITPATFLSGTFYAIQDLPMAFQVIARLNPLHYLIDGMRYSLVGYCDSSLVIGVAVTSLVTLTLVFCSCLMLRKGYRIMP